MTPGRRSLADLPRRGGIVDKLVGMRYPLAGELKFHAVGPMENVALALRSGRRFPQAGPPVAEGCASAVRPESSEDGIRISGTPAAGAVEAP